MAYPTIKDLNKVSIKNFKSNKNIICFDNDTKFMAVSSNKGTIHIFSLKSTIQKLKKLEEKKKRKRKQEINEKESEDKIEELKEEEEEDDDNFFFKEKKKEKKKKNKKKI